MIILYIPIFDKDIEENVLFLCGERESLGPDLLPVSHKDASHFIALKSSKGSEEVSLGKLFRHRNQEASPPISERLGIDVGL